MCPTARASYYHNRHTSAIPRSRLGVTTSPAGPVKVIFVVVFPGAQRHRCCLLKVITRLPQRTKTARSLICPTGGRPCTRPHFHVRSPRMRRGDAGCAYPAGSGFIRSEGTTDARVSKQQCGRKFGVHGGPLMLDIGGDVGALVVYLPDSFAGTEIEIGWSDSDELFTHTGGHPRGTGGTLHQTAVYPELKTGDYQLWHPTDAAPLGPAVHVERVPCRRVCHRPDSSETGCGSRVEPAGFGSGTAQRAAQPRSRTRTRSQSLNPRPPRGHRGGH